MNDDQLKKTIAYYNDQATHFYKNTVDLDVSTLYAPFLSCVRPAGHILDAGCGSGRDSLFFLKQGFQVTSFDASIEMVKLAQELTHQPVIHTTFQNIEFKNSFDGIWACASILHVPRVSIHTVLSKLTDSLKDAGYFYASFRYGLDEVIRDGRYFNNYSFESFSEVVSAHQKLSVIKMWKTIDVRPDRKKIEWLNIIMQKI